jgi:hypothetical protein
VAQEGSAIGLATSTGSPLSFGFGRAARQGTTADEAEPPAGVMSALAERVYLTAMPTLGRVKKDPAVEKLITKVARGRVREELRGWGQVRARRRPDEASWRVDLDGDARLIP